MNGFSLSAHTWLAATESNSLPLIFLNLDYDIWMTNLRATTTVRKHTRHSNDSKEYWDFSIDDMVSHDMPIIFEFI